jgi:hypothetical protein
MQWMSDISFINKLIEYWFCLLKLKIPTQLNSLIQSFNHWVTFILFHSNLYWFLFSFFFYHLLKQFQFNKWVFTLILRLHFFEFLNLIFINMLLQQLHLVINRYLWEMLINWIKIAIHVLYCIQPFILSLLFTPIWFWDLPLH